MTQNSKKERNVPNKGKTPNLRFPGFSEFWKEKRLDQIATIERGRFSPRPRNNPIYYSGNIPFVQTSDVVNSNGEIDSYSQTLNEKGLKVSKLFPKGTILITIAANIGYSGVLQKDMACPDSLVGLKCFKKTNNVFLNYTLIKEQPRMDYLAVAAAQKNINIEFLKPYKVFIPTLDEQIKVAAFLSLIDTRIQTQNEIIEDYELLKKGMMQKLFKQKIRFKDDKGNPFPEWEKKKLGQIFGSFKGKGLSKDKLVENGDYKCVLYGELYTTYQEIIYKVISSTNAKEGESSKKGDLLVVSVRATTPYILV